MSPSTAAMRRSGVDAIRAAIEAEPGEWTPGLLAADLGVDRSTITAWLAHVPHHRRRGSQWRLPRLAAVRREVPVTAAALQRLLVVLDHGLAVTAADAAAILGVPRTRAYDVLLDLCRDCVAVEWPPVCVVGDQRTRERVWVGGRWA